MLNRTAQYLLAAIQAIIGWEWFVSGCNKIFSNAFPPQLIDTLRDGMKDNPNTWYVAFLHYVILPNSTFFGYCIEWTELLLGIVLIGGAIVLLGQQHFQGDPEHDMAVGFSIMSAVAAAIGIFLAVNFHFWTHGPLIPFFNASQPNQEGIDLNALLPPLSLVIIFAHIAFIKTIQRQTRIAVNPSAAKVQKA